MDNSYALIPMSNDTESNLMAEYAPFLCMSAITLLALAMGSKSTDIESEGEDNVDEEITETSIVPYKPKMGDAEVLRNAIVSSLTKGTPISSKEIVTEIRKMIPSIKKTDVNSCLYTMLNKKKVTKSADKRPLWAMV
jgi:hypothetical protein